MAQEQRIKHSESQHEQGGSPAPQNASVPQPPEQPKHTANAELVKKWNSTLLEAPIPLKTLLPNGPQLGTAKQGEKLKTTGAVPLSVELVNDLAYGLAGASKRVPQILKLLARNGLWTPKSPAPWGPIDEKLLEHLFSNQRDLQTRPDIKHSLQQIFGIATFECRENAAIMLAQILAHQANAPLERIASEVSLVFGILFDDQYAPEGIGHAWLTMRDKLLDPSVTAVPGTSEDRMRVFPRSSPYYIPIVSQTFSVDRKTHAFKASEKQLHVKISADNPEPQP